MTDTSPIRLPILYMLDSKGEIRQWQTWTELNEDGTAVEMNESGIQGGSLSGIPITVVKGTNIGKSNETTPLQQANKRIQAKYDKKIREGYVTNLAEFTQQGVMLALPWQTSKHRMSKIAFHQPKLDGIRCKFINKSDDFVLMSRSNKEFKPFLRDLDCFRFLAENTREYDERDGELYIHGVEFNDIASLVMGYKMTTEEFLEYCTDTEEGLRVDLKVKEILELVYIGDFCPVQDPQVSAPKFDESVGAIEIGRNAGWIFPGHSIADVQLIGTSELQYWVYDIPDHENVFEQRSIGLPEYADASDVGIVPVIPVEFDIDDIEEVNANYVAQGFEGTIVRNPASLYAFGNRSPGLLKYKLFFDAEWIITGYEIDREGNPTFKFMSDAGYEFLVRPTGDRALRRRLLADAPSLIGSRATLRYQKLFEETLIPQFARMLSIRDYE